MKNITVVLFLVLTSCATIGYQKTYELRLSSKGNYGKVEIQNAVYLLPAKVPVERCKEDLKVKLIADSATTEFTLKPVVSSGFAYGNLFWAPLAPVAYLVDLTTKKRFSYGNSVYLNPDDSVRVIKSRILPAVVSERCRNFFSTETKDNVGQINLSVSLPLVNTFYLKPQFEGIKEKTGFLGASLGLEYFHKKNRYYGFTVNSVLDLPVPGPASVDYEGEYETVNSVYFGLTNNLAIKHFHIGYGINYSRNSWSWNYNERGTSVPPTRDPISKKNQAAGVIVNAYYQMTSHFFVGVIYRPTILRISPTPEFSYEHLISVDIGWKFKLKK